MARNHFELSIIYVNWNSLQYLRESLNSVYETVSGISFEIIVVDNCSDPSEALKLEQEFPGVFVHRSNLNLGFARANNLGAKLSSGNWLLFLNPDTLVRRSAIATMLARLKASGAGVIGCRLVNSDGSLQTSCIQRFPTITNQLLDIEFLRLKWPTLQLFGIAPLFEDTSNHVDDVEVVSGACLMTTKSLFLAVGGFNEQYFMYAEDVDFCYQARKRGSKVVFTGEAEVVHHGGGASKWRRGSAWIATMQRQAILQFCQSTRGPIYAAAYRLAMALNAACRLLLLTASYPFRSVALRHQLIHSSAAKWVSVLTWALGLRRVQSVSRTV